MNENPIPKDLRRRLKTLQAQTQPAPTPALLEFLADPSSSLGEHGHLVGATKETDMTDNVGRIRGLVARLGTAGRVAVISALVLAGGVGTAAAATAVNAVIDDTPPSTVGLDDGQGNDESALKDSSDDQGDETTDQNDDGNATDPSDDGPNDQADDSQGEHVNGGSSSGGDNTDDYSDSADDQGDDSQGDNSGSSDQGDDDQGDNADDQGDDSQGDNSDDQGDDNQSNNSGSSDQADDGSSDDQGGGSGSSDQGDDDSQSSDDGQSQD